MKIIKTLLLSFTALLLTLAGYAQTSARLYNENYMFTALYDDFSGTSLSGQWHETTNYAREIGYFVKSPSTIGVDSTGLKLSMLYSPNYMGTVWKSDGWHTVYYNYIGGEINSNESFSYGVFECLAKFAHNIGSMPAFWTMGGDGVL